MGRAPWPARFRSNRDRSVTFWIPYNPMLVQQWKQGVPYRFRSYNAEDDHAWTVFPPYAESALQMFFRHYIGAEEISDPPPRHERPQARDNSAAYAVLHLLPSAPRAVVDASYRALAKANHPDLGGDPAVMRALTEAHEWLSRRLSA